MACKNICTKIQKYVIFKDMSNLSKASGCFQDKIVYQNFTAESFVTEC